MPQDFAFRKMSPQGCMPFSRSDKSFRGRVCLLKRPRKISAAINTFSATRKFFVRRLPRVNNSVSRNRTFSQRAEGFNHSAEGTNGSTNPSKATEDVLRMAGPVDGYPNIAPILVDSDSVKRGPFLTNGEH